MWHNEWIVYCSACFLIVTTVSAHSKLLMKHRYCPTQGEGSAECEACVLIWTGECPELH